MITLKTLRATILGRIVDLEPRPVVLVGVNPSGGFSPLAVTAEAAASGTLTFDTRPTDTDTVTIGIKTYTFVDLVKATTTLTSSNVAPSDGDQVAIGNKTYTFKTTLTPTEGQVLINTTADAALLNLIRAINHTGTPDTDYKCAAAHTQVSAAASVTAHAFLITALDAGTAGNALATTVPVGTTHSFTGTVMSGGTDPTVNGTVKTGVSAATALDNLKSAVNLTTGNGTTYKDTAAHTQVTATTNTDTTQLFVAILTGGAGNSIATTETFTAAGNVFGGAVLTGGTYASLITHAI